MDENDTNFKMDEGIDGWMDGCSERRTSICY